MSHRKSISPLKLPQRLFSALLAAALLIQVTGCQSLFKTKAIDGDFYRFLKGLNREAPTGDYKADELKATAELLRSSVEGLKLAVNKKLTLKGKLQGEDVEAAKNWIRVNEPIMDSWILAIRQQANGLGDLIHRLSKQSYNSNSQSEIARLNGLLYFALQYYRQALRYMMGAGTPLLLGAAWEKFNGDEDIGNFRKRLLDTYFGFLGLSIVVDQDLGMVVMALEVQRKMGVIPSFELLAIENSARKISEQERSSTDKIKKAVSGLSIDQQKQTQAKLQEFMQQFKGNSLLYKPGSNYNPLVKLLTVLSNLTWGLFNTLVGVGMILVTMVVSPFTRYVDFPTFRIAANGMMIYVDATGMGPMRGKLSMGIFEFDNGTGHGFASGHEGGHSIQSALLGPFYLPAVMASYLISGFDKGFIENWADSLARWN